MNLSILSCRIEEFTKNPSDNIINDDELIVLNSIGIMINYKERVIAMVYSVNFEYENKPIIKLKTRHEYLLDNKLWDSFVVNNQFTISQDILKYIGEITINTSRGMLAVNLNETEYEKYIIPLVDINNLIDKPFIADVKDIVKKQ